MPHLCDKMRRLTTKDLGKRKKTSEGEPTPDFYKLSQENPLPESAPMPTTATLTSPTMSGRQGDIPNTDVELALLERRRADIFNRMNLLAGGNSGMSNLGLGVPQQDFQMNNNSLVAAAALSLGNNGRGTNQFGQPSLQHQSFFGGTGNVGQIFDNSNSALQRQLLEARLANSDMASILGFNQNNMQQSGMNAFGGFSL